MLSCGRCWSAAQLDTLPLKHVETMLVTRGTQWVKMRMDVLDCTVPRHTNQAQTLEIFSVDQLSFFAFSGGGWVGV